MLTAEELHVLYEGIKLNQVNRYDYILTGESTVVSDTPTSKQTNRFNRSVGQSLRLQQGQLLPGDGGRHYPGAEEGQSQPGVRCVCQLNSCICDCSSVQNVAVNWEFCKQHKNTVFIYVNELQRVASHFNLQEHQKLELIKKMSGMSLSDAVIMASNGPSNLQHIRSCSN